MGGLRTFLHADFPSSCSLWSGAAPGRPHRWSGWFLPQQSRCGRTIRPVKGPAEPPRRGPLCFRRSVKGRRLICLLSPWILDSAHGTAFVGSGPGSSLDGESPGFCASWTGSRHGVDLERVGDGLAVVPAFAPGPGEDVGHP
jgi:hypothetical protein